MANPAWPLHTAVAPAAAATPRHSLLVRITHWITTVCVIALLVTGIEIIISHPRFYWGDTGNPNTPSLFDIPIPASRPWVNTGYNYVLPDQNGWSRSLHFDAAWIVIITGIVYVIAGAFNRHFRKNLVPPSTSPRSYNNIQRLTDLGVISVLFPIAIWTGFAMSPALVSAFPILGAIPDGHQSARTVHFFVAILTVLFLAVHIVKVYLAGFRSRVGAMITGAPSDQEDRP